MGKNWSKIKSLGVPLQETSENLKAPELVVDKRTLKKTGRTEQFATRVTKEWLNELKKIAKGERLHYVEVIEDALECYKKCANHRRKNRKEQDLKKEGFK